MSSFQEDETKDGKANYLPTYGTSRHPRIQEAMMPNLAPTNQNANGETLESCPSACCSHANLDSSMSSYTGPNQTLRLVRGSVHPPRPGELFFPLIISSTTGNMANFKGGRR